MYDSTKIKLKRTLRWLKKVPLTQNNESIESNIQENHIDFGEPIFIDNNSGIIDHSKKCNSYLAIGSSVSSENNSTISNAAIFKGFWDPDKADKIVFCKSDNSGLIDEDNNSVYADKVTVEPVNINSDGIASDRYYILCQPDVIKSETLHGSVKKFEIEKLGSDGEKSGIYITNKGIMHGAAWNDYAEKRSIKTNTYPGMVVCEVGDGSLVTSSKRLQSCPYVVTDTYGFVIGEDKDTPVAVAGRALVYLNTEDRYNVSIGDCLCAGEFGKASIMTREEIKEYPDRILGIVTGVPIEDKWNGVDVNNRVWIKIK